MKRKKYISSRHERTYGRPLPETVKFVNFDKEQIEEYKTGGFVEIQLNFPDSSYSSNIEHFFIDTYPLQSTASPKSAWFSEILSNHLRVRISSGKKDIPEGATELDTNRVLEGLEIQFYYKVYDFNNPDNQTPFSVHFLPLYNRTAQSGKARKRLQKQDRKPDASSLL